MLTEDHQGEKIDRLINALDRLQQTLERPRSVASTNGSYHETATAQQPVLLRKSHTDAPAFVCLGPTTLAIRAGTSFDGGSWGSVWEHDTIIEGPGEFIPGHDYVVTASAAGRARIVPATDDLLMGDPAVLGGFHFALGGNAERREGGDTKPQVNPYSIWDRTFRPSCPDPRGMTLVNGRVWTDIFLLGTEHLANGTSRHGATIADGATPPQKTDDSGFYEEFTWDVAQEVFAHHGKGLLSVTEFFDAAYGVTERTSVGSDPVKTGLDAARTSKWGLMQATGNMWTWGHDGDPDDPHAYYFGGYWADAAASGSRASHWGSAPWNSNANFGARGRSDHLNLAELAR